MVEPETDSTADDDVRTRQLNSRVPVELYQVIKYLASRQRLSMGKLVEEILREYAASKLEEAKAEARANVELAQQDSALLEQMTAESLHTSSNTRRPGRRRAS